MSQGSQWARGLREALIAARGGGCERRGCGSPDRVEFHHRRRNGLNGSSRGGYRRAVDVLLHPDLYILLCYPHHRAEEGYADGGGCR